MTEYIIYNMPRMNDKRAEIASAAATHAQLNPAGQVPCPG